LNKSGIGRIADHSLVSAVQSEGDEPVMTTTSELRSQVEAKGEEISQTVQKIETRIGDYVDWKGMVQQKPLESLGIAMGVGLVLSGAAAPLLTVVSRQAGTIVKGSITAYLMNLVAQKTSTSPI